MMRFLLALLLALAPLAATAQTTDRNPPITVARPADNDNSLRAAPTGWVNSAISAAMAGKVSDAPSNGTYYLRRNGTWTAFGGPLADAPNDGQVYGRSGGSWAAIGGSGGSASVTNASVIAALGYTPVNKAGDTLTGPLQAASATLGATVRDWPATNASRFFVSGSGAQLSDCAWMENCPAKSTDTAFVQALIRNATQQGTNIAENTLRLDTYANTGFNASAGIGDKVGFSNTLEVGPNGGHSWGMATNTLIDPGAQSQQVFGAEFDMGNNAKPCMTRMSCYNIWAYGNTIYPLNDIIALSTPETTPIAGVPATWTGSTAYAITNSAPLVKNGANYYRLTVGGTSGSTGPTGTTPNVDIVDGTAHWQWYDPEFLFTGHDTSPYLGGASIYGVGILGPNIAQEAAVAESSHARYGFYSDDGAKHVATLYDRSHSDTGILLAGAYTGPAIKATSSAMSNNAAGTSVGCAYTEGAFGPDPAGDQWIPTCYGTFASATGGIKFYPTRATARDGNGAVTSDSNTASLVQWHGDGNQPYSYVGQAINFDVAGGSWTNAINPATGHRRNTEGSNAVGQFMSCAQRPGPAGEMPAYVWCNNTDMIVEAGSGNVQSYVNEWDLTNFNNDCYAGGPCLSSWLFLNGIAGHPNTAYIYAGAGQVNDTYAGTVTTSNGTITRKTGSPFTPEILRMRINNSQIIHVQYVDADHMTAVYPIPVNSTTELPFTAATSMAHNGLLWSGENLVADADMQFDTAAYTGLQLGGQHYIGINLAGDQANFGVIRRRGMNDCYNSTSGCFVYDLAQPFLGYNNGAIKLYDNGTLSAGPMNAAGTITASGTISASAGVNVGSGQGLCLNGAASCFAYNAGSYLSYNGNIRLYDNGTLNAGPMNASGQITATSFATTGGVSSGSISTGTIAASGTISASAGLNLGSGQTLCTNGAGNCMAYNGTYGAIVFDTPIRPNTGIKHAPTTYAALPGCGPSNDGLEMYIKDGVSVTWHAGASGGGTTPSKVMCMSTSGGSAWLYN